MSRVWSIDALGADLHTDRQCDKKIDDHHIMMIISLLTVRERRHQCSMVCHRWNRLAHQPESNVHLIINLSYVQSKHSMIPSPEVYERLSHYRIPFSIVQTLRLVKSPTLGPCNYCWILERPRVQVSFMKIPSDSEVRSFHEMPQLVTLTMEDTVKWFLLHQLLMSGSVPRLQHLIMDLDKSDECGLVCDLFLRRRWTPSSSSSLHSLISSSMCTTASRSGRSEVTYIPASFATSVVSSLPTLLSWIELSQLPTINGRTAIPCDHCKRITLCQSALKFFSLFCYIPMDQQWCHTCLVTTGHWERHIGTPSRLPFPF
jgi:hypothetical protein